MPPLRLIFGISAPAILAADISAGNVLAYSLPKVFRMVAVAVAVGGELPRRSILSKSEAAEYLSISERTLWSITAPRGPLPCIRIRSRVLFDVADLNHYVETNKTRKNMLA